MVTAILFVLVLVALIVVHEFGHFVVAKLSGMRVDEFGLGYPPRIWGFRKGETEYTLNAVPFGGFVRIYGEDEADAVEGTKEQPRSFAARPRVLQALVLVAGIAMNLLFAYVLISAALAMGTTRALSDDEIPYAKDVSLMVGSILPGSPAEVAGLKEGDIITSVSGVGSGFTGYDTSTFVNYIATDADMTPLTIVASRGGASVTLTATPAAGVITTDAARPALGVSLATVGTVHTPLLQAPIEGATLTWELTRETAVGLYTFFAGVFTLHANLAQVSGPVGIAGAVGSAARQGVDTLLTITAVISINLALINLIPIPALDGGRLLFVLIEAVIRRPIKPSVARTVNTAGFALLLLLMVVITGHDVFKLFT